ncbi:MAG: rhodanese-like domain-containing protein [Flavobacteriia bacterium]
MGLLTNLFGKSVDYSTLVRGGAIIIDVRSSGEFAGGHIKGSKNIPLQELPKKLNSLPKDKVIITCCASGMRSASAKNTLKSNGFKEVHNGGGWMRLKEKI